MNTSLTIGGAPIPPGTRRTVELPVAKLYTHGDITMPVHIIRGRKPGPCLFVCAALHGDEINGVEIIRRIIRRRVMGGLRGTLLAIPVVNVHGLVNRSRYLPDRRDLNRSFPGGQEGSMAARLADLFLREIVVPSQYGVDLHTGSNYRTNFPQVRAQLDDDETERLARAFGAPVVLDAALPQGSLRKEAENLDATVIVYEGGEALRFDEFAVRIGVRGVLATMRAIGMLPQQKTENAVSRTHLSRRSVWVRAPQSGILRNIVKLGTKINRDQVLGVIGDPFGANEAEVAAPHSGILIGMSTLPLANEGEALYHIALFAEPEVVAERIKSIRQDFESEPDE